MESTPLLPLPEGMLIDQIQITENGLVIALIATHPTACCPLCSEKSSSIHSHYRRSLRDAPCAGRDVQLSLTSRKFYCRNPLCQREVFTERLPDFVEPWARTTIRHCEQITCIGLATCGKAGSRLAARLGMHISRQRILRRIMALSDPPIGSILYLGIDDLRVSSWLPVRHHPGESGEPSSSGSLTRSEGRNGRLPGCESFLT